MDHIFSCDVTFCILKLNVPQVFYCKLEDKYCNALPDLIPYENPAFMLMFLAASRVLSMCSHSACVSFWNQLSHFVLFLAPAFQSACISDVVFAASDTREFSICPHRKLSLFITSHLLLLSNKSYPHIVSCAPAFSIMNYSEINHELFF